MIRLRYLFLLLCTALLHLPAAAQNATAPTPDMAEGLRASGKIYVVVLVLATIFAGIIAFLIYMERRLARLERNAKIPA